MEEKLLSYFGANIESYFPDQQIQHHAVLVSAVFAKLRKMVAVGDPCAIELAVFLIRKDPMWLPFGKLIKSDLARALKKNLAQITPAYREQIIAVTVKLLKAEYAPRELEDYAKLIKKFPRCEYAGLLASVQPQCDKARHIMAYWGDNP